MTAPPFPPGNQGTCAEGWTAPVLAAKKAYAVASGRLTALDVTTGAQLWQRAIDTTGLSASTVYAVDAGRVFVGRIDCLSQSDPLGSVLAFDATTGAPLWSQPVDGLVGLAVSGNRVLGAGSSAGSGDTLRVLDAATGAVVWQRLNTPTCGVAARIVRAQVYYQDCNATGDPVALVAARLADGVVVWRNLLYLPTGQVLNSANGAVVTRLWTGQHPAVTVGNGYVLTVPTEFSRTLDVYGLPGS